MCRSGVVYEWSGVDVCNGVMVSSGVYEGSGV